MSDWNGRGMTYYSLPAPESDVVWDEAPNYVKMAATRSARAARVLGIYRRRGWNPSAASREYSAAREALHAAIDRWEFEENNPSLF